MIDKWLVYLFKKNFSGFLETADKERVAQLQILNKAQKRQIEDLERKLEDSRRNLRYINHQFAIVKGEFHTVLRNQT